MFGFTLLNQIAGALGQSIANGLKTAVDQAGQSGIYIPTLTNFINVPTSVSAECTYQRTGDIVTVAGSVSTTAGGAGQCLMIMSLPVAPTSGFFLNFTDVAGTGVRLTAAASVFVNVQGYANVGFASAIFEWIAADAVARDLTFILQYRLA